MAQESCNLDKEEAEILKPTPAPAPAPSSSQTPPPPQSSPSPPRFVNCPQEFTAKKLESSKNQSQEPKPSSARLGNRCSSCRKRVGLTGFRCRCGELFCGQHRYSDTHDCSFDYKALGREQISKANPVIRAAKIIKI